MAYVEPVTCLELEEDVENELLELEAISVG